MSERRHLDILLQFLVGISVVLHPKGEDLSNVINDGRVCWFLCLDWAFVLEFLLNGQLVYVGWSLQGTLLEVRVILFFVIFHELVGLVFGEDEFKGLVLAECQVFLCILACNFQFVLRLS